MQIHVPAHPKGREHKKPYAEPFYARYPAYAQIGLLNFEAVQGQNSFYYLCWFVLYNKANNVRPYGVEKLKIFAKDKEEIAKLYKYTASN